MGEWLRYHDETTYDPIPAGWVFGGVLPGCMFGAFWGADLHTCRGCGGIGLKGKIWGGQVRLVGYLIYVPIHIYHTQTDGVVWVRYGVWLVWRCLDVMTLRPSRRGNLDVLSGMSLYCYNRNEDNTLKLGLDLTLNKQIRQCFEMDVLIKCM
ncbi:hypothetical protein F4814DRAFT_266189 [Daldinia grandis]|nr:hypothetical protein F4814DRAFT_266189 [Daldinia grandis]